MPKAELDWCRHSLQWQTYILSGWARGHSNCTSLHWQVARMLTFVCTWPHISESWMVVVRVTCRLDMSRVWAECGRCRIYFSPISFKFRPIEMPNLELLLFAQSGSSVLFWGMLLVAVPRWKCPARLQCRLINGPFLRNVCASLCACHYYNCEGRFESVVYFWPYSETSMRTWADGNSRSTTQQHVQCLSRLVSTAEEYSAAKFRDR